MTLPQLFLPLGLAILCAGAHAQGEPLAARDLRTALYMQPAGKSSQHSFADVFRLTVAASAQPASPGGEQPRLIAVSPRAPSAEPVFRVRSRPEPRGWLLALTGLLLAGWVGARRLAYFQ